MTKTIVAIIDAGGRGSALVDAYAKSPKVDEILFIPGNDLAQINTTKPVHTFPNLKTTSKDEILKLCKEYKVTLVDVAQDDAIGAGVADLLRENDFKVFGASKSAGRIEWDKAWSREFMVKNHLPIPSFKVCKTETEGIEFIKTQKDRAWFIKASGLAEGKGVIPAQNNKEALLAIKEMSKFGDSGSTFLIEQALTGEEFTSFAISDGKNYQILTNAQDHKRIDDGDKGPNTGGMGCSTPALVVDQNIKAQVEGIFKQTFEGLKKENLVYQGIVYLGGIVVRENDQDKVYIIEYNSRWGDPEVECILPGVKNDWFEAASAVADGGLPHVNHDGKSRIVVAAASKGYPEDYSRVKGKEIKGLDEILKVPGIKVYGAGVSCHLFEPEAMRASSQSRRPERSSEGSPGYFARGGRLFYVVAEGKDVIEARQKAYEALKLVSIPGENGENLLHYRTDIGYRDVKRLNST